MLNQMWEDLVAGGYIIWLFLNPYDGRCWYVTDQC